MERGLPDAFKLEASTMKYTKKYKYTVVKKTQELPGAYAEHVTEKCVIRFTEHLLMHRRTVDLDIRCVQVGEWGVPSLFRSMWALSSAHGDVWRSPKPTRYSRYAQEFPRIIISWPPQKVGEFPDLFVAVSASRHQVNGRPSG